MNDPKVFYQNEDKWAIAEEIYGTKKKTMTSNYYILNLPGEKKAEFVNSIPFTPSDKQNLSGLLMARNDGKNYGKLVLFTLPKSKVTSKKNKRSEQSVTRQVGLSGLASVATTIGLGCVPCGTSLILPLVAVFFSGAAAATAATVASTLVLILALLLSLFSLYKSGQIAFMYTELAKQGDV